MKTVRRYVAPAEAAGMVPGGPPVSEEQWRALSRDMFPELAGRFPVELVSGVPVRQGDATGKRSST